VSYFGFDTSTSNGQPIELYVFQQATQTWYYTSGKDIVTRLGVEHEPAAITRSSISQSNEVSGSSISLGFPRNHEFAVQFLGFSPDLVTTLTIYRGHATDTDNEYQVYWKGRVISCSASGSDLTLECESVFTSLRRTGLRASYQRTCRHTLYSESCTVNMNSYMVSGLVQSTTSNVVVCTQAGAFASGWFTGGMIRLPSGAMRFITNHTGSSLTLSRPFNESIGGTTIEIFPGCDHLKATCVSKYNNVLNFGGFPYTPNHNPFGGTSIA
jgi:uncharacterized phage protein (TIGR02218 family)